MVMSVGTIQTDRAVGCYRTSATLQSSDTEDKLVIKGKASGTLSMSKRRFPLVYQLPSEFSTGSNRGFHADTYGVRSGIIGLDLNECNTGCKCACSGAAISSDTLMLRLFTSNMHYIT